MFKVVPDQLRISDGWVRCGQCGEIFDASQHLLANPNDAVAAPADNPIDATRDNAVPDAPPAPVPAVTVTAEEPRWVETVAPEPAPPVAAPVLPQDETPVPTPLVAAQPTDEDPPDVSFMRDGKHKSIWQRPMVRIILLLLVLLLISALAAQVLIHERDRIAATEPSARPGLLALCTWTRCTLSPLRQIESIAIESSSFSLVRGDNYKLAFSLKNNAVLDLAMPAMELALTDGQDQALIRRVILPAAFGAASKPLPAGSDWSSSRSRCVKPGANMDRIAGYRLLAFYP